MNYYPSIKTILFSSISIVPLSLSAKQVGIKVLGEIKGIANPQEWECTQGTKGHARQRTYHDDGRIATYDLNGTRQGYSYNTTQPHTLRNIHTLPNRASDVLFSFAWDAKGNMTAQNSQGGSQRAMLWDERNRMLGMVDNATSGNAAHYVYDAQGERTFKLTGYSNHTGSGETSETYVSLDEPTLYASPYLTATATGYTKHYFAGTERLASAIGNGGLADIGIVGSEGLIIMFPKI